MDKKYESIISIILDDGEQPEICPLLSIAAKKEQRCIGSKCAMFVSNYVDDERDGSGKCGLTNPGHDRYDE